MAKAKKNRLLSQFIVDSAKELNLKYKETKNHKLELEHFLKQTFEPNVKKLCQTYKIQKCWPLSVKWNNARFAAFNTYAAKKNEIKALFKQKKLSLRGFMNFVKEREESYNGDGNFIDYLKQGN